MQTFLPYADFHESAHVLDNKRLGKQRVETLQVMLGVLRINLDGSLKTTNRTWGDHVIGKMWAPYLDSLLDYQKAICHEWHQVRGYKDTCLGKTAMALARGATTQNLNGTPPWLGDEAVHASHRSNLLRKFPEFYSQYGWEEPDDLPYVWPRVELEAPTP